MTRRPAALLVTALLALVLAGCSSIPMTGPVRTVAPQQQTDDDRAAFVPNGPTDNMTPEEVVSGFVVAQGAGGDYDVAKEFLTEGFARSWRPNASVVVHTAQWSADEVNGADDQVRLRVPAVARVDESGQYTTTDDAPSRTYSLQQVRGQWRISGGENGVVLSLRTFQSLFTAVKLQFFAPGYRRLIPDVRWFPGGGSSAQADTAPDVVSAVLSGPSPVLQGVVLPVFPSGTVLAAPVRTSGDLITVSVRIPGSAPSTESTDRMQQALAQGLGQPTGSLRLVVNGAFAPVASPPQLEQPAIGDPVVVSGDRFGTVTAQGTVQDDRDLGPAIVKLNPTAVTVSARQRLAAVLDGGGRVDVVTRQRTLVADERSGLIAPTVDQRGWVYSIPRDDPTGLRVTNTDGDRFQVDADLGTSIVSIEVSADGTRLLVLDGAASGPRAYVAAILRDADGRPIGLSTDQYPVALGSTDALDATWVDTVSVAVLTNASSAQGVTVQQLGGIATSLFPLANARTIVGGTAQADLRARLLTGQVLQQSTLNGWALEFPPGLEVDVLAVQR